MLGPIRSDGQSMTDALAVAEAGGVRLREKSPGVPIIDVRVRRRCTAGGESAWYLRLRGFETESFESAARKSVSHSHLLGPAGLDPQEVRALMLRFATVCAGACARFGSRL